MSIDRELHTHEGKVVLITPADKLVYFKLKLEVNQNDPVYAALFKEIEKDVRENGIESESGRHYELEEIVETGETITLGEDKKPEIRDEYVAVFRLNPHTYHLRDGLPVEVVHRSAVKPS